VKATLLALALVGLGCHPEDFDAMERQPKLVPYGESDLFGDGKAMRSPPAGAIPRERVFEGAPPPLTAELLALGRSRFDSLCAACHGRLGDGDSVVASKVGLRPPPSLHEQRLRELDGRTLYGVIRDGYGLLPRFAERLDPSERWAVVAYVRALQLSQSAPLARLPVATQERLRAADQASVRRGAQ
jgi:mono/diheme cytochrome c family protein